MPIYIFFPSDFLPKLLNPSPGKFLGLKINKALYSLKQAGRMWYHLLRDFLILHEFLHDPSLPYIFTLLQTDEYVIVVVLMI